MPPGVRSSLSNFATNQLGRSFQEHLIQPEIAAQVLAELRSVVDGTVIAVDRGLGYGQEPQYPTRWPIPDDAEIATAEELIKQPMAKLLVRHAGIDDHWATVERPRTALRDLVELTSSGPNEALEISALGVTKASALALFAAQLGISANEVLACGDMPNDLPMLEWASRRIAPATAHAEVLAAVDEITADCDDDGVARALDRVFLT